MSPRGRVLVVLALMLSLGVAASGCSEGPSGANGAENPVGLPPSSDPALDAGREIIETKCSRCHTLDRVRQADKDRAEWATTIDRMQRNGLVITDEEVEQVLDYFESR